MGSDNRAKLVISDRKPLTYNELRKYATRYKILPENYLCEIVLQEKFIGEKHWVAYKKNALQVVQFESYGSPPPLLEKVSYFNLVVLVIFNIIIIYFQIVLH